MVQVEQIAAYTGHKGSVFSLITDEEERYAYSSGDDGVIARWDLNGTPDLGDAVLQASGSIYAMEQIPDLGWPAAGASDGTVYFVDLHSKKVAHSYKKIEGSIFGLHYEPWSQLLWVLHAKGVLSAIHVSTFKEEYFQRIAEDHLRSIAVVEQDFWIGSSDQHIYVFDREKMKPKKRWLAHENSVFSLAYHKSGKFLLSGGRDAHLKMWDLQQEGIPEVQSIPAHNFTVNDMAFSPQGDYVMTASRDKTLKLWDAYQLDLLKVVDLARHEGHKHSVNRVLWLKRDNSIISCSDDRRILRWRIKVQT